MGSGGVGEVDPDGDGEALGGVNDGTLGEDAAGVGVELEGLADGSGNDGIGAGDDAVVVVSGGVGGLIRGDRVEWPTTGENGSGGGSGDGDGGGQGGGGKRVGGCGFGGD